VYIILHKPDSSYYELDNTRCSITYLSSWTESFIQSQVYKDPTWL